MPKVFYVPLPLETVCGLSEFLPFLPLVDESSYLSCHCLMRVLTFLAIGWWVFLPFFPLVDESSYLSSHWLMIVITSLPIGCWENLPFLPLVDDSYYISCHWLMIVLTFLAIGWWQFLPFFPLVDESSETLIGSNPHSKVTISKDMMQNVFTSHSSMVTANIDQPKCWPWPWVLTLNSNLTLIYIISTIYRILFA